ncbi:hypothetical protein COLO4_29864 [Corchorus olitorius]|uniref:Uncharacterized protein n=1 Tax=Corchorus olitorius TaxID=93759 RepID=A0A1R3HCR5_9ROSI|nr:hypothetical protein COLO4_29864 [Corchorus olitorius]
MDNDQEPIDFVVFECHCGQHRVHMVGQHALNADGEFMFTWPCCGFIHRYRRELPKHEVDINEEEEIDLQNGNQNQQQGQHGHCNLNEDLLLIQGFEAFFGEAHPWAMTRDNFLPLRTNRSIRARMQILIRSCSTSSKPSRPCQSN